jgi:hypothetical protein
MRFSLILCIAVISNCGLLGIYIPASPVSLSMMTEWDLKRERTWVLCRGYHHPEYSSELIKAELKRRNSLRSCQIKGVVENEPDAWHEE